MKVEQRKILDNKSFYLLSQFENVLWYSYITVHFFSTYVSCKIKVRTLYVDKEIIMSNKIKGGSYGTLLL